MILPSIPESSVSKTPGFSRPYSSPTYSVPFEILVPSAMYGNLGSPVDFKWSINNLLTTKSYLVWNLSCHGLSKASLVRYG